MSHPPSSPRLPSPPPPTEDQIGPKSPGLDTQAGQMDQTLVDINSKRRIHPGTKAEDMAAGPPLVPLNELDSAFQLQEHLSALHNSYTKSGTQPVTRETATELATPPEGIDETLWLYELCRFLVMKCNTVTVGFFNDSPPCSQATCPEMRASEWQFLCAVHDSPKSCCAIDYCCHTLDWAGNVVTNPRIFPSRFTLLNEGHDSNAARKNLVNVFRRLHRIFAHAWFQHRGVFWNIESQTGLYVFFKRVCDLNNLLPAENYKLPPEAEGLDPADKEDSQPKITSIARPPSRDNAQEDDDRNSSLHARRNNTTRHASRPSTGSSITTVTEEQEDDQSEINNKLRGMHISAPETVEEESEAETVVEVPVIVEGQILDENAPTQPQQHQQPQIDIQELSVDELDTEEGEQQMDDTLDSNDIPAIEHEKPPTTEKASTTEEAAGDDSASADQNDDKPTLQSPDAATDGTTNPLETPSGPDASGTEDQKNSTLRSVEDES